MKILLFCLLFTVSAFSEVCLQGRSVTIDNLGNAKGGELCYINVKNIKGSALLQGQAVVFDTSVADGYSVTTSTTAGVSPVCVLMTACANNAVCKCQTYGYASWGKYDSGNGNATAGFLAFISENVAGYIQGETKASTAASDIPIGTFLETKTASADIKLFIKLR